MVPRKPEMSIVYPSMGKRPANIGQRYRGFEFGAAHLFDVEVRPSPCDAGFDLLRALRVAALDRQEWKVEMHVESLFLAKDIRGERRLRQTSARY